MFQRLTSTLWLFLFVLALPVQAFGYLLQAETQASARLQLDFETLPAYSQHDSDLLFEQIKQTSKPNPSTRSHNVHDWLANLHSYRWLNTTRFVDEGEANSSLDLPQVEPTALQLFRLYQPAAQPSGAHFSQRYSSHRIAGWKESNALYVALNSQFHLIS